MARRSHRKSRNGCVECKRRHRKCDETRPQCVNCMTAHLPCVFISKGKANAATDVTDRQNTPGSGASDEVPRRHPPAANATEALNLDHLQLLHHFCTVTCETFADSPGHQQVWKSNAVTIGLSFPFLMYEILAIAALHLAHCRPEQRDYYSTKATELQSHALNEFNAVQKDVDASNCSAVMLFSSLLAVHVLADPLRIKGLDFSDYLSHLFRCITLARSVRDLVIKDWYHLLSKSELTPLFDVSNPPIPYDIPEECHNLSKLTLNSDLCSTSVEAYEAAIERLQWTFAISGIPSQAYSTMSWYLAWPVQLKAEYLDLLDKRQPEALVILAYYAVLLHFYRGLWAVGDSGTFLINAINAHVGPDYQRWLTWPNDVIGSGSTAA